MSDDRRPFDSDPRQLDVPSFIEPRPARTVAPPAASGPDPLVSGRAATHRPVRWGRVSLALIVVCLPPMLVGARSAGAKSTGPKPAATTTPAPAAEPTTPEAVTPAPAHNLPPTAAPVAASTHVTLYNGTEREGLEQQAAERLKAVGYTVSMGKVMAGLTPHSYVCHVDHADAAAAVASSLGLNAPPQAVVADYPPVVETKTEQGASTQTEVVVILGDDYR